MPNVNNCTFIGTLTRDPELKFLPKGTAVVELSIAINHTYKTDTGEKREEVTFLELSAFGKQAETIAEYVKKGHPIYVEARAKQETWDDKETGKKRSKIKFIVANFQFLAAPPKRDESHQPPKAPSLTPRLPSDPALAVPPDDDQIPF